MKYVTVCFLALGFQFGAAASAPSDIADFSMRTAGDFDGALMLVIGAVLIALQLRRRQKSLRTARHLF